MVEPRNFVINDKRFPVDLTGAAGKVMVVNSAEDGFDLLPMGSLRATGVIFDWPFDTPPAGALAMNGQSITYDDFPDLCALFGLQSGDSMILKAINFKKNSMGVDTYTDEPADVGTHTHSMQSAGAHGHSGSTNSTGSHNHSTGGGRGASTNKVQIGSGISVYYGSATGTAGNHNHSLSISSVSSHTHPINQYTGTNQPACTRLLCCIWT